jgi:hypothetical protein
MASPESGEEPMKLKITQVEALLSTRLRITWENGKHTEVDVGDYLQENVTVCHCRLPLRPCI